MRFFAALFVLFFAGTAFAQETNFQTWLNDFRTRAISQGIAQPVLDQALSSAVFIDRVIELDRKQPEGQMTYAQYYKNTVTEQRVQKGRDLYLDNHQLLNRIHDAYGVPPQIILALWAKESNFGQNQGSYELISSLATLAYEGRRAAFFEKELINALKIMQQQNLSPTDLTGSWAGAMGQCQFMPSTYLNYAADGDNDGRIDIWHSKADVFESMANYLRSEGWKEGELWGRKVQLPAGFNRLLLGKDNKKTVSEWAALNVVKENGEPLQQSDIQGYLIEADPGGPGDDMYLVYNNFDVLLRWNKSRYFGLAVGELSDRMAE